MKKKITLMLMALAILWIAPMGMKAATINVPAGTYDGATQIQPIINGATAGDIINFGAGVTINGLFDINKELTLNGNGATINGACYITASNVTLQGFVFNATGASCTMIYDTGMSISISGVTISGNTYNLLATGSEDAIELGVYGSSQTYQATITGNTFNVPSGGKARNSIAVNGTATNDIAITGNTFNGQYAVPIFADAEISSYTDNTFSSSYSSTSGYVIYGDNLTLGAGLTPVDLVTGSVGISPADVVVYGLNGTTTNWYVVTFDVSAAGGAISTPDFQLVEVNTAPIDPATTAPTDAEFNAFLGGTLWLGWEDASNPGSPSTTLPAITGPMDFTGVWDVTAITVTSSNPKYGSVTPTVSPTTAVYTTSSGQLIVDNTATLTVTAAPADGYYVSNWLIDGVANNSTATSQTFTAPFPASVKVAFAKIPPPPMPANIEGPFSIDLTVGYSATSTEAYTITGTNPVIVKQISTDDDRITWNPLTNKFDIAAGLPIDTFQTVLQVKNDYRTMLFTFTVRVRDILFFIDLPTSFIGGTVKMDAPYYAAEGQTVTLTVTPDKGNTLESIKLYRSDTGAEIPLTCKGNVCTFVMPPAHINIVVKFSGPTGIEAVLTGLIAYAQDGTLYLNGLTPGATWSVYNITGSIVAQGVAAGDKVETALPSRGVYIIQSGNKVIKVMN